VSGFDQAIIEYIWRKLREGVGDAAIMEELTDSTDPLFTSINGDVGIAADYLTQAKAKPWGSQIP
jgi:hypothetical protein